MIKSAIKRWDAVDIDFARGDKRFGYVVDIQDGNVVVDCGSGTPLIVSAKQVLQAQEREPTFSELFAELIGGRQTELCRTLPVADGSFDMEAVLQQSPQEPFRWFPARSLFRALYAEYRLMEVQLPNQRVRCVLPSDHVRRLSFGYGVIGCGTLLDVLVKKRVPVPAEFVLSDRVRELWRKRFYDQYKIVDVRDGYLFYLKTNDKWSRDAETVPKFVAEITVALSCIHEILPEHVMLKIFKLLDTEHQARARRVCIQWNRWLHLPEIVRVVRIECWKEFELERSVIISDRDPGNDRDRKVAACLFHCLRSDTTKLVLTGFQMWQVLGTLESLLDFLPIHRIPEVVLAGMEEDFDCFSTEAHIKLGRLNDRWSKSVFAIHPTLQRVCEWLVLDNVTIKNVNCSFAFDDQVWYEHDLPEILTIKGVSARINLQSPGCAADLWTSLEQYCPVVSDGSRLLVEYGLHMAGQAECQSKEERDIWRLVDKMLYGFETCDPRHQDVPQRKFDEPMDWASVNVEDLNRVTLFILDNILIDCHSPETGRFGYFKDPVPTAAEKMQDEEEETDDEELDAE